MSGKEMRKMILLASIPAMTQMFLKMAVGIVNKIMVGQLGESVIAGVGVSEQLVFFLMMMFAAVGTGVTTLSSQYIGAKETDKIKHVFGSAMTFGIIASVIITTVFYIYSKDLLVLMGASPEIVAEGNKYLSVVSFTVVSIIITFIMTAIFRSYADNKTPMYASVVAMILDVGFAYFFIFHMKFGILGVAYSALIARNVELVIMLVMFQMKKSETGVALKDGLLFSKKVFSSIFKIGWPVSIDTIFWQLGGIVYTLIILRLGTIMTGVNEAVKIIPGIALMPVFGIAMTATAFIGQDLGKGDFEMAKRKASETLKMSFSIVIPISIILIFASNVIPNLFNFTQEGKSIAGIAIILTALMQVFNLPNLICSNIIRAGGDTKIIIFITVSGMWLVGIPMAYLLGIVLHMGLYGVIIGTGLGEGLKAILFYLRYRKGLWLRKLV